MEMLLSIRSIDMTMIKAFTGSLANFESNAKTFLISN